MQGIGKYGNRITPERAENIISLYKEGLSPTGISKEMNSILSNTAIRLFLNKQGYSTSKKKVDRSRPCKVCGKVFTPKCYDGVKKHKYRLCSEECNKISVKESKTKYTETQINHVIKLKKLATTNRDIEKISGVNLNKIKEITKDNDLYVGNEVAQRNAYQSKLKKNPNAMKDMRSYRIPIPEEEYSKLVDGIICQLKKSDNKLSIPYLCKQNDLNHNSVRNTMHKKGFGSLIKNQYSMGESEVFDFIKSCLPDIKIEQGNRTVIKPKEIDIYIPSLNLGIEYCGLYWHSEQAGKNKEYHKDKMIESNKQGVRLITIFEDEWNERGEQVKNFLKSVLQVNTGRIFARNCTVKKVEDKEIVRMFLENNHIQGKTMFEIAIGLYSDDKLVGVVTGNKHHRNFDDSIFILNRLVFDSGVQVVGGASRLVKSLIKYAKDSQYKTLISWSDNRWSEGNVYEKCGFTLDGELGPDYSYINQEKRLSKQSCQKNNLLKKGAIGDTESEMAGSLAYVRIWDCGKKKWQIIL